MIVILYRHYDKDKKVSFCPKRYFTLLVNCLLLLLCFIINKDHRSSDLLNYFKLKKNLIDNGQFHSFNHYKGLPVQILGSNTVKNVQIYPQTKEILS